MARLLSEGRTVALGRLVGMAIATGTSVLVARIAGTEGRGVLSLVTALPQVVMLVSGFGLMSANVFMIQRHGWEMDAVFGSGLVFLMLSATATALGLVLAADWLLGSILAGLSRTELLILAVALYPVFFHRLTVSLLHATRRIAVLMRQETLSHALRFVATAGLMSLVEPRVGIPLGFLVGTAVVSALDLQVLVRAGLRRLVCRADFLRRAIAFGVRSQAADIADGLQTRIDLFVVSMFCGVGQVGIFATARGLGELVLFPCIALTLPLYPRLVNMEPVAGGQLAAVAARALFWIALILSGLLVLTSHVVIEIVFGRAFAPARGPLLMLLAGTAPLAVCRVATSYLTSRGRPGAVAVLALCGFAVLLLLDIVLIPAHGPMGAAAASVAASLLVTTAAIILFVRTSGVGAGALFLPQEGDIGRVATALRQLRGRDAVDAP
jgi:O-antigen/teichoic acid export membrane protein